MSAKQTPENFWSKIKTGPPDECWEWQGARTSAGYGCVLWHGKVIQAHRAAYWLTYGGDSPLTKFRQVGWAKRYQRFVLHRCDNRPCCNPAHLFLGSMSTNLKDAYAKKRKVQPRSNHANAKLSPAAVRDIRLRYARGGVKQAELAAEYKVSQRAVSLVVRNETYKDVV
jgi:hypothetical protein